MKKSNLIIFFILFFNSLHIISGFRLFQDRVDKRKKDVIKDHESVKKNIIENIPYKLNEKLETKTNQFTKNLEEKSNYLVLNIETVKTNETKISKTQPVSSVKKNLTTSNKEFSIKIPPKNEDEVKEKTKDIPVLDVLSVEIKANVNKTDGGKKIDFHTLKDEDEKIKDIKAQIKKIKENIIDTRKELEVKKPDVVQVNKTEKNQSVIKEVDKKTQNISKVKDVKKEEKKEVKKDDKKEEVKKDVKKDENKVEKKDAVKKDDVKEVKKEVKKDDTKDSDKKDDKKDVVKKDDKKKVKQEVKKDDTKDSLKKDDKKDSVKKDDKKDVEKKVEKKDVVKKVDGGDKKGDKKDVKKDDVKKGDKKDVKKDDTKDKKGDKTTKDSKSADKKDVKKTVVKDDKKADSGKKDGAKKVTSATKIDVKDKETKAEKVVKDVKTKKTSRFVDPLNYFYNFKNVKNEKCKKDGQEFESNLSDGKMWAMKMYDASAKIPSNILKGNLNQLGDYDQCTNIAVKLHENKKDKLSGKYCLASIDIETNEDYMRLPVNLAQGRAFLRSRNKDPGHFIPKFSTIRWGVCVPDSCSADDVELMLKKHIENHNTSFSDLKFDIEVDPEECATKKHFNMLDMDYTTIAAVSVIVVFMVISLLATIRDYAFNVDRIEGDGSSVIDKIFMSFSIKQTKKSFLNTASDEIPCIHGIRALTTILLYIAHKLIPLGHSPYTNRVLLTEMSNSPFSIILRVSVIYTDTFLLLSGILTAYHMSKDLDVRGYIPWVNRIFSRIIRLLPTLLVVLLYYSYIMDETGSGPLWNTVITENSNLCKENWWKNVLFIQNLYPFEEMCATHTHQLALDMQLFLLAPALVWMLQKRTYLGLFITFLLHIISVGLRYYTTIKYKLSVIIYHGISLNQLFRTANLLYASSIHRATPYIAGICLGVTLRQVRPDFKIPKILSFITWIVAGYLIYWIFYTPVHLADRMYRYNVQEAALFSSFCSVAWAFALSWIIFSSHLNYEGYLNKYLSSTPMILISKLSYTIYLVQFIIFFYNVGTIRAPTEFNINEIINIKECSTIIVVSLILFLVVDLPMQEIKKILMRPSKPSKEESKVQESNNQEEISN